MSTKFDDGKGMNQTSRTEAVEKAIVRASDLPAHSYSIEKIMWAGNTHTIHYKARDIRGRHLLPLVVYASLTIEADANEARARVEASGLHNVWKSEPVSLDSASAARSYVEPRVMPDGSEGLGAYVLFSAKNVSGFVAVMGWEWTVHIRQAEALAERIAKRLAGKETSTRPAFRAISQSDLEETDAALFAGKDLQGRT